MFFTVPIPKVIIFSNQRDNHASRRERERKRKSSLALKNHNSYSVQFGALMAAGRLGSITTRLPLYVYKKGKKN